MSTQPITHAAILLPLLLACGIVHASVPNDDCGTATLVTDGTPAAEGDNSTASATDDAEASCQPSSDFDVWFEYVATCTGQITVDTFGSSQADTVLSVYVLMCGGPEIACSDDTGGLLSQVSFAVTATQSYWIRLASFGPPGDYDLNVSCTGVPGNDTCASAQVVTDGVPAAEGNNSQASATDDAEASCQPISDSDVWFEYVATCTGQTTVDTFGGGQADTVLSVYDACGGAEIACNDDIGSLISQVSFATSPGQSYWIRLASFGAPGDYDLNIACVGTPIPTVSEWGLVVMTLLLLTVGTVVLAADGRCSCNQQPPP